MAKKCPKCQAENSDTAKFCSECATPLASEKGQPSFTKTLETPISELSRGTLFADRYEIIEELGSGGMGKVYRVEDTKTNEEIAIKLIRPEIAADKRTIDRFRNELTTARKIRHKNVCGMYDLGEHKGSHYITMEYVSGEDLKSLVRRVTFDTGTAIKIAKQVCEGLAEAHRLGVVHRDLKPSNIMIDKEGNARIMDFGIARSLSTKGITGEGIIIGTPEYMSPEQAEAKEVDHRSDIYSLGVILYEMTTGQLPFEGDTPLSIAMKHKGEVPKDPNTMNLQIPEDLNLLILRCMEKDKKNRYSTADQVLADLKSIERDIPTAKKEIVRKMAKTSKEITVTLPPKKLFLPALVVTVLTIVVLIIWSPWRQQATAPILSDKPSVAIPYFENNTGNIQLDYLKRGLSELLITDLSQSRYIDVTTGDRIYSVLNELDLIRVDKYSTEDLVKIADKARVNHILTGGFIKIGDYFIMTLTLQKPHSGEIIRSMEKRSLGESDIPQKIDEITREIKSVFNFTKEQISSDLDKQIGDLTTNSPEAYRYFIEGLDQMLKHNNREVIKAMEKAIEIDPEFAMAHRFLATGYGNLGYVEESKQYMQKAFELKDRLSDRERYQIESSFYLGSYKTMDMAVEALERKTELYPDDWLGQTLLGFYYGDLEMWDKSIERSELAIQMEDPSFWPYYHIAEPFSALGSYDKAIEYLEHYRENYESHYEIALTYADIYLCQGKYDLALLENDFAYSLSPPELSGYYRSRWQIFVLTQQLEEAESLCSGLFEPSEPTDIIHGIVGLCYANYYKGKFKSLIDRKGQFIEFAEEHGDRSWKAKILLRMAYAHFNMGEYEQAMREAGEALGLARDLEILRLVILSLYLRGKIFLELNNIDGAASSAAELRSIIESSFYRKHIRFYYNLTGLIEMKRENVQDAAKYFERAISLLHFQKTKGNNDHALFIEPLAYACYLQGEMEKAQEEYKKIINLTTGRVYYGDIYARSYYMLGKIHEQQGDTAKAIEHYEKFLDLWKDADPGLAEVEDARKRLAGLR